MMLSSLCADRVGFFDMLIALLLVLVVVFLMRGKNQHRGAQHCDEVRLNLIS
jgi:hypothetical protein